MLRILLWKLGFEWAHLKRVLLPRTDQKILYFAFGANLSTTVLERRRIRVYDAFDYRLEGATLRFSQSGFYRDHGYASADVATDSVVYGRMYLILESDAERMDFFEGVPFLRVHKKLYQTEQSRRFFYYRARKPRAGLKPTAEYLDYLVSAYRSMSDVPGEYVEALANTETLETFLPQDQTGDFVEHIERWPGFVRPLLVLYERCCLRLVELLWNRSLIQWLIRERG